jgi:hypothetical protein
MGHESNLEVKTRKVLNYLIKVALITVFFVALDALGASKLAVFGDLRGHVEPCGCDPRTDVGGVRRIGAALVRYRGINQDVIVVSTGNFQEYGKDQSSAAKTLNSALEIIAPDVVLFNQLEWSAVEAREDLPKLPWVLSNYRGKSDKLKIHDIITKGGTEFYGVLPLTHPELDPVNQSLLRRFKKMTRVPLSDQRILIYAGPISRLRPLLLDGFFGTVILSNPTKIGVEIGDTERSKESSLMIALPGVGTGYAVPFGGAGILRLGGLESTDFPKTIAAIAVGSKQSLSSGTSLSSQISTAPLAAFPAARFFHWLDLGEESAVPEALLTLAETARKRDKEQFKSLAALREKDLPSSEFAGSQTCEACHKSAYDVWLKTKHASALATLVLKKRQEEPPCVECHVLGYTAKGGYVNEEKSPHFANVQCESCHGPRKAHVTNPGLSPKTKASESCAMCHTPPHSPGFHYKSYWKQIEHK